MGSEPSSVKCNSRCNHQCCNNRDTYSGQVCIPRNTCSQQYYNSGYVSYNHNPVSPSVTNPQQPIYREYFVTEDEHRNYPAADFNLEQQTALNNHNISPETNTKHLETTSTTLMKETNDENVRSQEKIYKSEKVNTTSTTITSQVSSKQNDESPEKKDIAEKSNVKKDSKLIETAIASETTVQTQTLSNSQKPSTTSDTTVTNSNNACPCEELINYVGSATDFYNALTLRRTHYDLTEEIPISRSELTDLVKKIVRICPSAFNIQSSRVVILYSYAHLRVWHIVKRALRKATTSAQYKESEQKVNGCFASGAGTILFYEDSDAIRQQQEQYPAYAANFPVWSQQSSAIAQFAV